MIFAAVGFLLITPTLGFQHGTTIHTHRDAGLVRRRISQGLGDYDEDVPRRSPPPPKHLNPTDKRQIEALKAMGYRYEPKRRRWVRGPPPPAVKLEARSSYRSIQLVPSGDAEPSEAIGRAVERFEEIVRDARAEQQSDQAMSLSKDFKVLVARPAAFYTWCALQVSVLTSLTLGCPLNLLGWDDFPLLSTAPDNSNLATAVGGIGVGVLAGLGVAWCERRRWKALAGTEPFDGALVRVLADAKLGSHALPAPHDWRVTFPAWLQIMLGCDLLASANAMILWHAGIQQEILDLSWFDPAAAHFPVDAAVVPHEPTWVGAAVAVACVAALKAATANVFWTQDGADREVQAAAAAAERAPAYYALISPGTEAANAESAAVLKGLADEWADAFGGAGRVEDGGAGVQLEAVLLAGCVAALEAGAWQLAGGNVLAPLAAHATYLVDRYLINPEPDRNTLKVPLDDLVLAPPAARGDDGLGVGDDGAVGGGAAAAVE